MHGICKVCGCTDKDCSQCIEKTGEACYWVDDDHELCSACVENNLEKVEFIKLTLIDNLLGVSSNNIKLEQESFFSLVPGDKITQIGCGKENGTIRTSVFEPYITYSGSHVFKNEKLFAFEIPFLKGNFYLFGKTEEEIYTESYYSIDRNTKQVKTYMRFYNPVFKKYIEQNN